MQKQAKLIALHRSLISLCGAIMMATSSCSAASTTHANSSPTLTATATTSSPTATATASSPTFPAFHDWRAVYLAPDHHFHAVSIDGKTDVIGPSFAGFGGGATTITSAGASPDGHFIAFVNFVSLTVYDMHAQTPASMLVHTGEKYAPISMFWSPNSQQVALGADQFYRNGTVVANVAPLTITTTGPIAGTDTGETVGTYPEGWLDNHTLLIYTFQVQNTTPFSSTGILEAVDSTTGAKRTIATFPHAEQFNARFALSSDGQEVLVYTFPAHDQPFTPKAFIIDTATGAIHPLPTKSGQTSLQEAGVTGAVWRPGTHDVAVTVFGIDPTMPNVGNWLLNTDTGALTPIQSPYAAQSWSPDGTTLVLSDAQNNQNGTTTGPFTLMGATFDANGKVTLTKLTDQAMAFTFLGFIRSA